MIRISIRIYGVYLIFPCLYCPLSLLNWNIGGTANCRSNKRWLGLPTNSRVGRFVRTGSNNVRYGSSRKDDSENYDRSYRSEVVILEKPSKVSRVKTSEKFRLEDKRYIYEVLTKKFFYLNFNFNVQITLSTVTESRLLMFRSVI